MQTVYATEWRGIWDQRKTSLKRLSDAVLKRALVVCAAHLRHKNVKEVGTFVRCGATSTYTCAKEQILIHVWNNNSEARRFEAGFAQLWQVLYDYGISMIRAPVALLCSYRCSLCSVVVVPPLYSTEPVTVGPSSCPMLHFFASSVQKLMGGMRLVQLYRGVDGWFYAIGMDGLMPLHAAREGGDRSYTARPEIYPQAKLALDSASLSFLPASTLDQSVLMTAEKLLSVLTSEDTAAFLRQGKMSEVCHSCGLNLRMLYRVLISPPVSTEKRGKSAAAAECVLGEMAFRSLKEMLRADLRAHFDEEDSIAADRLNRLLFSCIAKKADVWETQLNAVARQKFDAPDDLSIPFSPSLLKSITARFATKHGFAFDSATSAFAGRFQGSLAAICYFALPEPVKAVVKEEVQDADLLKKSMSGAPDASKKEDDKLGDITLTTSSGNFGTDPKAESAKNNEEALMEVSIHLRRRESVLAMGLVPTKIVAPSEADEPGLSAYDRIRREVAKQRHQEFLTPHQ